MLDNECTYLLEADETNTLVGSLESNSLENHTLFQTIMDKIYTRFRTKTAKTHTLGGGIYIYSLCRGVPPPPGIIDRH